MSHSSIQIIKSPIDKAEKAINKALEAKRNSSLQSTHIISEKVESKANTTEDEAALKKQQAELKKLNKDAKDPKVKPADLKKFDETVKDLEDSIKELQAKIDAAPVTLVETPLLVAVIATSNP